MEIGPRSHALPTGESKRGPRSSNAAEKVRSEPCPGTRYSRASATGLNRKPTRCAMRGSKGCMVIVGILGAKEALPRVPSPFSVVLTWRRPLPEPSSPRHALRLLRHRSTSRTAYRGPRIMADSRESRHLQRQGGFLVRDGGGDRFEYSPRTLSRIACNRD